MQSIQALIGSIKSQPSDSARAAEAQRLARFLHDQSPTKLAVVDAAAVDDIANLLSDSDDRVRFWAAAALGVLGPKATSAVPKLEEALKDAHVKSTPIQPAQSTEAAITHALERIRGVGSEPEVQ
jgi:HEAT repeat protein